MIQKIRIWFGIAVMVTTCFVFFIFIPAVAFTNLYKAHQAEHWPSVSGVVTVSNWTVGRKMSHQIHFAYNYEVKSHTYSGDRYVFHSTWTYGNNETDQITSEYPVGSKLMVHYSPENPSESVIVPGKISSELMGMLYILLPIDIFIVLPIISFILWLKIKGRKIPPADREAALEKWNSHRA